MVDDLGLLYSNGLLVLSREYGVYSKKGLEGVVLPYPGTSLAFEATV